MTKSWASKFGPAMAKNHWLGCRVLVSVDMVPGGPHFTILPLTAAAISETVHRVFDSDSGGFGELGFMENLVAIEIECLLGFMIESRCQEECGVGVADIASKTKSAIQV